MSDTNSTEMVIVTTLGDVVTKEIENIITERKLRYIDTSPEFTEGLLVGLEIAGRFGDKIHEMYSNKYNITPE